MSSGLLSAGLLSTCVKGTLAGSRTFDLRYVFPPSPASFSSFTDRWSNRDTSVPVAMFVDDVTRNKRPTRRDKRRIAILLSVGHRKLKLILCDASPLSVDQRLSYFDQHASGRPSNKIATSASFSKPQPHDPSRPVIEPR